MSQFRAQDPSPFLTCAECFVLASPGGRVETPVGCFVSSDGMPVIKGSAQSPFRKRLHKFCSQ